jgi:hypothetical protein
MQKFESNLRFTIGILLGLLGVVIKCVGGVGVKEGFSFQYSF